MSERQILLVEGPDDEHVIKAICGQRGLPKIKEIHQCQGITQLLESLPVRLKESDIGILGLVVDADENLSSRWDSIKSRLRDAGYTNLPAAPSPTGSVIHPPVDSLLPKVGVWLMPNNLTAGILEDFLKFLVPDMNNNTLFSHAQSAVDNIPASQIKFSLVAKPKVLIHTWLAWQEEPGRPLGQSITARFLDHDVPEVTTFVSWLSNLFDFNTEGLPIAN
jgi:hypothetical protein